MNSLNGPNEPRRRLTRRHFMLASAAGTIGAGAYQYGSRDRLQVRKQTLALPKWNADGYRVALVSDLHLNTQSDLNRGLRAMELAVAEKPDLLLLGGDYLNFKESIAFVGQWVAKMARPGCPIYAIFGNHDFWSQATKELSELFSKSGIPLLRNDVVEHQGVVLYGIDDGIERKDRHDQLESKHDSGSILALFHEPDYVGRVDPRISLMLAGHSHGGQVCWPFGKPIMMPVGARRYWDGFYPNTKVPLYVSRGVGMTGPRFRLFCPPDISILTLEQSA